MTNFTELEAHTRELSIAIKGFVTYCQNTVPTIYSANDVPVQIPSEAQEEARRARESALASILKIQAILAEPTDFLQQMAIQTQLLACIQWLGKFQVPAHIPPDGTALMTDVADLIGVPANQLCRIIRMATTAGFLQEPQPGHVAHTKLSASFVTKPSYLDATMFLAGKVAPAALEMAAVTKQHPGSSSSITKSNTFSNEIPNHISTFSKVDKTQLSRLQRQWHAYLLYGLGHFCDTSIDILTCLETIRTGNACVVEVGARSTARGIALANQYPNLHFTVQINPAYASSFKRKDFRASEISKTRHSRVNVQPRVPGTPQPIPDAAVYILNCPLPEPGISSALLATQIKTEVEMHLDALRMSRLATLVLIVPSLLEQGVGGGVEQPMMLARLRDLSFLQLGNERELEVSEIMDLLNAVGDSEGRLVVVNKVRSKEGSGNGAVALEVRYQAYADLRKTSIFI